MQPYVQLIPASDDAGMRGKAKTNADWPVGHFVVTKRPIAIALPPIF